MLICDLGWHLQNQALLLLLGLVALQSHNMTFQANDNSTPESPLSMQIPPLQSADASHARHKAHFQNNPPFLVTSINKKFLATAAGIQQKDKQLVKCYFKTLRASYLKWQEKKTWEK